MPADGWYEWARLPDGRRIPHFLSAADGGPIALAGIWETWRDAEGRELQRRFFDYFLKGDENGWDREPRMRLSVHSWDGRVEQRGEDQWPPARTQWTRLYLEPGSLALAWEPPGSTGQASFEALGDPITLMAPPLGR